jgi:hypothetical protein
VQVRREESSGTAGGAKAGPGLAKVYSNSTSLVPQEYPAELVPGKETSSGSPAIQGAGAQWPGRTASLMHGVDFVAGSQRGGMPGGAGSAQAPSAPPVLSSSQPLTAQAAAQAAQWGQEAGAPGLRRGGLNGPLANYSSFHAEQDRWRRSVGEVNNQWVQKLQECAKTNADVQNLLRYYMSLPDVAHVYPVSADARIGPMGSTATAASGGAPSAGMAGANGAASVGALQNGSGTLQVRMRVPHACAACMCAARTDARRGACRGAAR